VEEHPLTWLSQSDEHEGQFDTQTANGATEISGAKSHTSLSHIYTRI